MSQRSRHILNLALEKPRSSLSRSAAQENECASPAPSLRDRNPLPQPSTSVPQNVHPLANNCVAPPLLTMEKCKSWLAGQCHHLSPKPKSLVCYSDSPSAASTQTSVNSVGRTSRGGNFKRKLFPTERNDLEKTVEHKNTDTLQDRSAEKKIKVSTDLKRNSSASASSSSVQLHVSADHEELFKTLHSKGTVDPAPALDTFDCQIETEDITLIDIHNSDDTMILDLDIATEILVGGGEENISSAGMVIVPPQVPNDQLTSKKRENQPKPAPIGLKRTKNTAAWLKGQAKAALHSGKAYVTSKGKEVAAKTIGPPCNASCKLQCSNNISEAARHQIFNDFYRTQNQQSKWQFIKSLVHAKDQKCPKDEDNPKRTQRKYHLMINHQLVEVCPTIFFNTLFISSFMVQTALKRNVVSPERRGGRRLSRLIPESILRSIDDHIASFPRVASHYCRSETTYEYLETNVKSISNMHRLYVEGMNVNREREKIATIRQYEDRFNNNHRIKFFKPRKDLCDQCMSYSLIDKSTLTQEQQKNYEDHILSKDLANVLANQDKANYGKCKNPEVVLCHMDLQKVLLLPKSNASEAYYKMKLTVLDFTIYDLSESQGHCFVWNETVGKKDANAISSFVLAFLTEKAAQGKKTIIIWSDNCGAQNKNRYLFAMYLMTSAKLGIKIIHRFFIKGHTQNESDSMHACIELAGKNDNIFVPEEWCEIMERAKVRGKPYIVNRVAQSDIHDFHRLTDGLLSWPQDASWSKISEVIVDFHKSPWTLSIKHDLGDTHSTVLSVKSKLPGRPVNLISFQPSRAFNKPIPINKRKKADLMDLISKGIIPQHHVPFFQSLPTLQAGEENDNEDFYST